MDIIPEGDGLIYPSAEGVITSIGEDDIYGKYILIDHGEYQTFYAHLKTIYWQDVENRKVIGEKVTTESRIGFYGNTGKTVPIIGDGSHLHYEVRWKDDVKEVYFPVNPQEFLEAGMLSLENKGDKDGTG
jgi:murein DD-endopeptidase MepM/ murein hydrolase activator NlpD